MRLSCAFMTVGRFFFYGRYSNDVACVKINAQEKRNYEYSAQIEKSTRDSAARVHVIGKYIRAFKLIQYFSSDNIGVWFSLDLFRMSKIFKLQWVEIQFYYEAVIYLLPFLLREC